MDNSPYLDKPFVPVAVALPRMLATIERDCRLRDQKKMAGWKCRPSWCAIYPAPSRNPSA